MTQPPAVYLRIIDRDSAYYGKTGAVIARSDLGSEYSPADNYPMVRLELPYGEKRWFLAANLAATGLSEWPTR